MARYKKHEWSGKYQKILIYAEQGLPVQEIANRVDMHQATVYKFMRSDKFMQRKEEFDKHIIEKARRVFEEHAIEAANKIVRISKSGKPEERIQLDAAKEVLYQVGIKPVEVIETRKREYTPEELQSAARAAKEIEEISNRLLGKKSEFVLEDTPIERIEGLVAKSDEEKIETQTTETLSKEESNV